MPHFIDWESVCLVCLQNDESRFIFGEDIDSNVIADKIMKCADILIERNANQPQNICIKCLEDLNVAFKFRRNCEQSDSIIKTLLSTNHQEFDIRGLWKTTPTTENPTQDIHIKDEIVVYAVVDDTCGGNTPCHDLEDEPDTETEHLVEDKVDEACDNKSTPCLDLEHDPNPEAKSIVENVGDACYDKSTTLLDYIGNPDTEAKFVIENVVENGCEDKSTSCLDFKDDPGTQAELLVKDRGDSSKESKIKQEANCGITKRPRGRPRKSTAAVCAKVKLKCASKGRTQKICKICGQSFRFQIPFKIHMKLHDNERSFSCDHCDKVFVTAPELQCHVKVHTTQEPYKCQYCDCWFSDYTVREKHESTHRSEKPYKCPTCNKSFAYSRDLRIHTCEEKFETCFQKLMPCRLTRDELNKSSGHKQIQRLEKEIFQIENNASSDEINIKCEIVEVVMDDNNDITQQSNGEILNLPRSPSKAEKVCEICNHGFRDQSALDDHIRRHNNERPFTCDHCDKAFVRLPELRRHMRVHTVQKPLKCQYCECRFSDYNVRKNHERIHTGKRPFKCSTCAKTSVTKSNGVPFQNGEEKFMCTKCGEGFTEKVFLVEHVYYHMPPDELNKSSEHQQKIPTEKEMFQIEENPYSNEIHIKHEIVENALVPDDCNNENTHYLGLEDDPLSETENKKIAEQSDVETPKRPRGRPKTLTGISLKICEICNRSFKDQHNLDIHMRYHNNERPFSCDHCDKAFVRAADLRRHVRMHTGQKPYKCQYCDRRFSDCSVRRCHERTHTGERPYVCPTCGKSFTYSYALTVHHRIHAVGKEVKRPEKEIVQTDPCVNSIEINIKPEEEIY